MSDSNIEGIRTESNSPTHVIAGLFPVSYLLQVYSRSYEGGQFQHGVPFPLLMQKRSFINEKNTLTKHTSFLAFSKPLAKPVEPDAS